MALVKLPKMDKHEIAELVAGQTICRIAFKGAEHPYVALFQYAFIDGFLYFHFTDYGRKMRLLDEDSEVCVEIEKYQPDLSDYRFVVLVGKLKIVVDPYERAKAIKKMVEDGQKKLSTNFLAAHGLKREEGWASFTADKSFMIVKLDEISEQMGVKSP